MPAVGTSNRRRLPLQSHRPFEAPAAGWPRTWTELLLGFAGMFLGAILLGKVLGVAIAWLWPPRPPTIVLPAANQGYLWVRNGGPGAKSARDAGLAL